MFLSCLCWFAKLVNSKGLVAKLWSSRVLLLEFLHYYFFSSTRNLSILNAVLLFWPVPAELTPPGPFSLGALNSTSALPSETSYFECSHLAKLFTQVTEATSYVHRSVLVTVTVTAAFTECWQYATGNSSPPVFYPVLFISSFGELASLLAGGSGEAETCWV